MTAWAVTATKNRFRAGVMGAGVSDWGQLAAESDLPEFEVCFRYMTIDVKLMKCTDGPWRECSLDARRKNRFEGQPHSICERSRNGSADSARRER